MDFRGSKRIEIKEARSGDIVGLSGIEGINIGDTIADIENMEPLPRIAVDEPTISMVFSVNTSPFAGQEGRYVTSRNLRERLEKELLYNVSIKVDFDSTDSFKVMGRGELQLAILIEMIRRRVMSFLSPCRRALQRTSMAFFTSPWNIWS